MSKNTTLNDTVETTVNITKDENFKDVIRYKAIASLLIKLTIPDLKIKLW
jgi:predicted ATP-dependent Lon-type protease